MNVLDTRGQPVDPFVTQCVENWEEDGVPKLVAYWDGYRAWTVGFGHTGPEVVKGYTITRAQADQLLAEDLQNSANNVDRVVKVPINQKMRAVLISFDFNEGDGALDGSTLLRVLNSGDYAGVVDELARWVYAEDATGKMRYSAGLANRRAKEAAVWGQGLAEANSGQAPAPAIVPQASVPQPSAPVPIQPTIPDAAPTPPPPVKQDPDNNPQPSLWTSTTVIGAITAILGSGGAAFLGSINNPYALGAVGIVAIMGFVIIRERMKTRAIGGT